MMALQPAARRSLWTGSTNFWIKKLKRKVMSDDEDEPSNDFHITCCVDSFWLFASTSRRQRLRQGIMARGHWHQQLQNCFSPLETSYTSWFIQLYEKAIVQLESTDFWIKCKVWVYLIGNTELYNSPKNPLFMQLKFYFSVTFVEAII